MSPQITPPQNCAWVTLVTRASYTPGVLTLAYSLQKHKSTFPLICLVTPSLPASSLSVLNAYAKLNPLFKVQSITPLLPRKEQLPDSLIAARFEDTWTKLRVFELVDYEVVCFLDADIVCYRNVDDLMAWPLPSESHLAATHACVCNLDKDKWADPSWRKENCAFTALRHPSAMNTAAQVPSTNVKDDESMKEKYETQTLLNGGVLLFKPSTSLRDEMFHSFDTSTKLKQYKFPDQDFLADFFRDRWVGLPWWSNALKTMRYWHENIWTSNEDVGFLHYIVDKPWSKRIASDGIAGHLGRDGETHSWWWKVWDEFVEKVQGTEEGKTILDVMKKEDLVKGDLSKEEDEKQCKENEEEGFPIPVPAH